MLIPPSDEEKIVKNYKGDFNLLGKPEKYISKVYKCLNIANFNHEI